MRRGGRSAVQQGESILYGELPDSHHQEARVSSALQANFLWSGFRFQNTAMKFTGFEFSTMCINIYVYHIYTQLYNSNDENKSTNNNKNQNMNMYIYHNTVRMDTTLQTKKSRQIVVDPWVDRGSE